MNLEEFTQIMSYFISAYPNANISKPTAKVYFEHLKDIPYVIMQKSAAKIVETAKFFPSIAEIREKCIKEEKPEYSRSITEVLELLQNTISSFGRYKTKEALEYIKEQDIVLYHIVKAIRFINICNTDLFNYRNEIEKLYKATADDIRKSAQLSGITTSQIMKLGKELEHKALAMQSNDFEF